MRCGTGKRDVLSVAVGERFPNHVFVDSTLAQILNEVFERGCRLKFGQILAKSLANIGPNQGLVSGETELGSNALEIVDDVFRDPHTDGDHGTVLSQAAVEFIGFHIPAFLSGWLPVLR